MATKKSSGQQVVKHKDGSTWAKGMMVNGECDGYWEWFRKDSTKMRSGNFKMGKQIGEWVTYDRKGQKHKTTNFDKSR